MITQPVKWHGGKHYLASWIIQHMPPHTHYVEPFFGGGSVLLKKSPFKVSEVVNDLDGELTNFWRTLACPERFKEFSRIITAVPFIEEWWKQAGEEEGRWITPLAMKEVKRSVAFFVRARQSRQGLMEDFATLSRRRTRRGMNEQVSAFLTAVEGLEDVHERMKRVVVLNHDAVDVIRQQDGVGTLFYCDPPYLHDTRVTTEDYRFEMTRMDHRHLLGMLARIKGRFLLSGYPSAMYRVAEEEYGWKKDVKEIDNKASGKGVKDIKEECLWMNFSISEGKGV